MTTASLPRVKDLNQKLTNRRFLEKLICMSECGSNDSSDDDVGGRASEWYEVGI